jgi:NAD(P)-dependent dehydrogenase (short-subunit alcohol dehydrogenase family)
MDIRGQGALVSGGASGLGTATARALAAAGAVVTVVDLDEATGQALADEIGGFFVRCDVSDEEQVQAAVAVADGEVPLRVAVSCAGVGQGARIVARDGSPFPLDLYRRVVKVNQTGTFNVLRLHRLPQRRDHQAGRRHSDAPSVSPVAGGCAR